MTSGHGNATYNNGQHSNHSNGLGHSNTSGSVGHGNTGSHYVSWEGTGGTYDFPSRTCEGSLVYLYEKSEQIRNQYNSASKLNTSSLLPTKPEKIVLGTTSSSSSLLYKLLNNARNQGGSNYMATNFTVSGTYNTKPDSYSQWVGGAGGHGNTHSNSGHSSHVNSSYLGDIFQSGSRSVTAAGNATVSLAYRFAAWNTANILSDGSNIKGETGSSALKDTLDALWTVLRKNCVTSSNSLAVTVNVGTISNRETGHSNYSAYSDDYSKREYKTNIKKTDRNALDDINKINIVEFNYKPEYGDPTINRVGFIADDTDEIFSTRYHDRMDYMNCIGMLLKSVQELSAKVSKLEEELKRKN